MLNMIKADFYRMIRSRAFYIAAAIMLAMLALSIYIVEPGNVGIHFSTSTEENAQMNSALAELDYEQLNALSLKDYRALRLSMEGYHLDENVLGNNINLYYVFIFIASAAVAADFSGSCVKNTLSSAISRRNYFLSKFIFVMLCCVILLFFNTYLLFVGNLLFNGSHMASDLWSVTRITLLQIPPMLALAGILSGFAFLLKKMASFHMAVIPFIIIMQILLHLLFFAFRLPEKWMHYELQTMIARLSQTPSTPYILQSYAVCAGIVLLFGAVGWLSFRKAEIK